MWYHRYDLVRHKKAQTKVRALEKARHRFVAFNSIPPLSFRRAPSRPHPLLHRSDPGHTVEEAWRHFGQSRFWLPWPAAKWRLACAQQTRHVGRMKTASVQQVPQQWTQILEWVAAGEEVEVTEQEKVIAKVVPATQPDFLARAKKIWGEQPSGKPLSELVAQARGGES